VYPALLLLRSILPPGALPVQLLFWRHDVRRTMPCRLPDQARALERPCALVYGRHIDGVRASSDRNACLPLLLGIASGLVPSQRHAKPDVLTLGSTDRPSYVLAPVVRHAMGGPLGGG
jgi:hypothetical protein